SHPRTQVFGYFQLIPMSSNSPVQRLYLITLKQLFANAVGLAADWVNPLDQVQSPNEKMTFSPGCIFLRLMSWPKLPLTALGSDESALPSTLSEAAYGRW